MSNVIIFGPPGIGKSTIIKRLSMLVGPDRAIDLEEPRNRELLEKHGWAWMFEDGRLGGANYIGGADLDPQAQYPGTLKVILTLPQEAYECRRRARDRKLPEKAAQPPQSVGDWRGISDAFYVEADEYAIDRIIDIRSRW